MIDSIAELRRLLADTPLADADIAQVDAPAGETIFAIAVGADAMGAWQRLRDLLPVTGRWPVLTCLWASSEGPWAQRIDDNELMSRFYFMQEDTRRPDHRPGSILAAADGVDVDAALAAIGIDDSLSLEEYLECTLAHTANRFGTTPEIGAPVEFLAAQRLQTPRDIEQWLFDWEQAHCPGPLALADNDLAHIEPFVPDVGETALLLMPAASGSDVPAYLNWYASGRVNSESIVALLRQWHARHGAELVAHYGTMLQLRVARRPQSAQEAFDLAWQQETVAPCTTVLPGVALRDHARALLHTDSWHLHERP